MTTEERLPLLRDLQAARFRLEAAAADERQARADRNRLLLEGRKRGYTIRDLAEVAGLTAVRVHQLTGGAGVGPLARGPRQKETTDGHDA